MDLNGPTKETEVQRQIRERAEDLKLIPPYAADKSRWPRNIRTVGMDEINNLATDAEGRLYWDGSLIKMERRIVLGTWELRWVAVAAIGALLSGITDLVGFGCDRPFFTQLAICEVTSPPVSTSLDPPTTSPLPAVEDDAIPPAN